MAHRLARRTVALSSLVAVLLGGAALPAAPVTEPVEDPTDEIGDTVEGVADDLDELGDDATDAVERILEGVTDTLPAPDGGDPEPQPPTPPPSPTPTPPDGDGDGPDEPPAGGGPPPTAQPDDAPSVLQRIVAALAEGDSAPPPDLTMLSGVPDPASGPSRIEPPTYLLLTAVTLLVAVGGGHVLRGARRR